MFADLGAKVTILEFLPKILPGLDADVANVVVRSFKKKQIDIRTGVKVTAHAERLVPRPRSVQRAAAESVEVDACIVSVGRRPYADQLGLGGTAVKVTDRGFVDVEFCRTGEPGVYAVGDLIDTPQLAHVGYAEAILVVKQIVGEDPMPVMIAAGDLLPPGSGVGRAGRGCVQGGRDRRRRRQAPVQVQQPGADRARPKA